MAGAEPERHELTRKCDRALKLKGEPTKKDIARAQAKVTKAVVTKDVQQLANPSTSPPSLTGIRAAIEADKQRVASGEASKPPETESEYMKQFKERAKKSRDKHCF